MSDSTRNLFGTVGEFANGKATLAAAHELRAAGFERWDVFSPAPLEGIDELMPSRRPAYLTAIMFGAAVIGACLGYFVQWENTVLEYPLNVAGHPYNGWPGFIPSAWESCALFAVYAGFLAFLISCRLPKLYHPIYAVPDFQRASQDRFFICVETRDGKYERERLRKLFRDHGAINTTEIPE